MNQKTNKIKLFFGVILFLTVIFLIYSFQGDEKYVNQIETSIFKYYENEIELLDFSKILIEEWDTLFIYGEYTSCQDITKELNTPIYFLRCLLANLNNKEVVLFVFQLNGKIVGDAVIRPYIRFDLDNNSFSLNEAKFRVDDYGYLRWVNE